MVKSCIHKIWWPELHQNMPYLSPYHRPVPNSIKFCENIEIPWKWANSVARLKILHSAENCGPYISWHHTSYLYGNNLCNLASNVEYQTIVMCTYTVSQTADEWLLSTAKNTAYSTNSTTSICCDLLHNKLCNKSTKNRSNGVCTSQPTSTDNAPYMWVPWKFSRVPDHTHGYFSGIFNGLLFGWTCKYTGQIWSP